MTRWKLMEGLKLIDLIILSSLRAVGMDLIKTKTGLRLIGGEVSPVLLELIRQHKTELLTRLDDEREEREFYSRPVGPIPDWKPGETSRVQEIYIIDFFGEKKAFLKSFIDSVIEHNNRTSKKNQPEKNNQTKNLFQGGAA